jgi:hypothetical protein
MSEHPNTAEGDAALVALVRKLFDIGLDDAEAARVLQRKGFGPDDILRIKPLMPARQKGAAHG